MEDHMEQLALFGQFLGGLGLFFTGVGVLWFVTIHQEKKE
jgi:hypothetical protein